MLLENIGPVLLIGGLLRNIHTGLVFMTDYLSFGDIVLGSKPVIVVLDEENVDEDGGVDEQREGDDEEESPLNSISHFCSMLLVLKANLRTYCMMGMRLKVITSLLCEFISFFG